MTADLRSYRSAVLRCARFSPPSRDSYIHSNNGGLTSPTHNFHLNLRSSVHAPSQVILLPSYGSVTQPTASSQQHISLAAAATLQANKADPKVRALRHRQREVAAYLHMTRGVRPSANGSQSSRIQPSSSTYYGPIPSLPQTTLPVDSFTRSAYGRTAQGGAQARLAKQQAQAAQLNESRGGIIAANGSQSARGSSHNPYQVKQHPWDGLQMRTNELAPIGMSRSGPLGGSNALPLGGGTFSGTGPISLNLGLAPSHGGGGGGGGAGGPFNNFSESQPLTNTQYSHQQAYEHQQHLGHQAHLHAQQQQEGGLGQASLYSFYAAAAQQNNEPSYTRASLAQPAPIQTIPIGQTYSSILTAANNAYGLPTDARYSTEIQPSFYTTLPKNSSYLDGAMTHRHRANYNEFKPAGFSITQKLKSKGIEEYAVPLLG
jgi:hypothetical protein